MIKTGENTFTVVVLNPLQYNPYTELEKSGVGGRV